MKEVGSSMKCPSCGLVYARGPAQLKCPNCHPRAAGGQPKAQDTFSAASPPTSYEWLADQPLVFDLGELHDVFRSILIAGLKEGAPVKKVADRLGLKQRELAGSADETLCWDVAHTEMLRAMNASSFAGMLHHRLFRRKEWVSGTTCRHKAMNGKKRLMAEPFIVHGYPMMYPGDASEAPLKEVLHCSCTLVVATD
jgi:hypothetical protein